MSLTQIIRLKGVRIFAYHGVFSQERKVGNHFQVDLDVALSAPSLCDSDELSDTISYADLYQIVVQEMNIPSKLLENVATRIIRHLQISFPDTIDHVRIEITKLNPPIGADLSGASVCYEWKKS